MRKVIVVLSMAALSVAGVAVTGGVAGASAPAQKVSKVCKILTDLDIEPSSDPGAEGGRENAAKVAKKLRKAAKKVKGDIKKTLKTMADYFDAIADEDIDAIQDQAEDWSKALVKYSAYVLEKCIGDTLDSLPDIPGVDIPDISIPGQ